MKLFKRVLALLLCLTVLLPLALPAAAADETLLFQTSDHADLEEAMTVCGQAMAEIIYRALDCGETDVKATAKVQCASREDMTELTNAMLSASSNMYSHALLPFFHLLVPSCYDDFLRMELKAGNVSESCSDHMFCQSSSSFLSGAWDYETSMTLTVSGEGDEALRAYLREVADAAMAASDTDEGRLRYVNRWLIDHVRYGRPEKYLAYVRSDGVKVYYGEGGQGAKELFEEGMAVCAGYTNAVSLLCLMLGIANVKLLDYDHAWNLVRVDGVWKMLDVTWNDTEGSELKYFLVDNLDGVRDHNWRNVLTEETLDAAKTMALALRNRLRELRQAGAKRAEPERAKLSVQVGGREIAWPDALPFIDENQRTLVPLRPIAEAMGLEVSWDAAAREASFRLGARSIRFPIGSAVADTSEGALRMDTAAILRDNRTYAPVRYLAEYFGWTVSWDGATRTVMIA